MLDRRDGRPRPARPSARPSAARCAASACGSAPSRVCLPGLLQARRARARRPPWPRARRRRLAPAAGRRRAACPTPAPRRARCRRLRPARRAARSPCRSSSSSGSTSCCAPRRAGRRRRVLSDQALRGAGLERGRGAPRSCGPWASPRRQGPDEPTLAAPRQGRPPALRPSRRRTRPSPPWRRCKAASRAAPPPAQAPAPGCRKRPRRRPRERRGLPHRRLALARPLLQDPQPGRAVRGRGRRVRLTRAGVRRPDSTSPAAPSDPATGWSSPSAAGWSAVRVEALRRTARPGRRGAGALRRRWTRPGCAG